jgi:DeoR family fructose operon transcriptional repressor
LRVPAAHAQRSDGSTSPSRRLPAGRKAELTAYVAEVGEVTVAQLAERFDVSPDTIRRDLDQLDAEGVLIRTHGGAVSPSALPRAETGLDVRRRVQAAAKDRIGALAATLVQDSSALMVNAGTTTLAVVRSLRDHRDLTVATNSIQIPTEISPQVVRDLYVFGGAVRLGAQATIGPVVFRNGITGGEADVRCDLAVIGVGAVSAEGGYSVSNLAEATMIADMIRRSSRVAIVADSSKFGRRLFAQVVGLDQADYLVTDASPAPDLLEALEAGGVQVMVASAADGRS